jgi:hypothetical protein
MWDQYLTYISTLKDEVSPELKLKIESSYSFLRKEFGETFLSNHVKNHPVGSKIFNRAPWQLEELVDFTNTLKVLKEYDSNYESLLAKLKSRDRAKAEGVPMVEIAQMFLSNGLKVRFEPSVDYHKKPDLEIFDTLTNEKLFGELTILNDSDDRNKKSDDYHILFRMLELTPPYAQYSCIQKQPLTDDARDSLSKSIPMWKEKVVNENAFQTFGNEFISIAFSSEEKIDLLKEWCEAYELELNEVKGCNLEFDETKRIINNKLKEKASQIPPSHNGIVFIRVNPLYFHSDGVVNSLNRIPQNLSLYPNVLGIVLFSFLTFEKQDNLIQIEKSFLSIKQTNRLTSRYLLYLANPSVDLKISSSVLDRVVTSLK